MSERSSYAVVYSLHAMTKYCYDMINLFYTEIIKSGIVIKSLCYVVHSSCAVAKSFYAVQILNIK